MPASGVVRPSGHGRMQARDKVDRRVIRSVSIDRSGVDSIDGRGAGAVSCVGGQAGVVVVPTLANARCHHGATKQQEHPQSTPPPSTGQPQIEGQPRGVLACCVLVGGSAVVGRTDDPDHLESAAAADPSFVRRRRRSLITFIHPSIHPNKSFPAHAHTHREGEKPKKPAPSPASHNKKEWHPRC